MEQKPTPRRFADVFDTCILALRYRRDLSRNERYAVETILELTYAAGYASLPVASSEDLSDALELGGRQNLHTLLRRLLNMDILRWEAGTSVRPASYRVNPNPQTWGRGLSNPASVECAARATAARSRLLHHLQTLSAQGEFFPETSDAEWEAEAAQERVPGPVPSELTSAPAANRHRSYDEANPDGVLRHETYDDEGADCHRSYDENPAVRHRTYDESSPRAGAPASERARPRQNHDDVTESRHVHGSDARGLAIVESLESFWVEVGLDPALVKEYRQTWARRILAKPLRVERCLYGARVFRDGGNKPRKGWGHYLNYLFTLGQERNAGGPTTAAATPSEQRQPSPAGAAVKPAAEAVTDEERQRRVAEWREQRRTQTAGNQGDAR